MNPLRVVILLLACWVVPALAQALAPAVERSNSEIPDLPTDVLEGQDFTVTVHYELAPEVGPATLHVELKNAQEEVLTWQTAQVAGKGQKAFTFKAPLRKAAARVKFAVWFGEVWTASIGPIIQSPDVDVLAGQEAAKLAALRAAAEGWRARMKEQLAGGPVAAVLVDDLPGLDRELADMLLARLRDAGMTAVPLTVEEATNRFLLRQGNISLLVLTSARVFPMEGVQAIQQYLAHGGNLIALDTPAFRTPVRKVGNRWLSEEQVRALLTKQPVEKMLYDFESGTAQDWGYNTGGGEPATWEFSAGGAAGTAHALHCVIPKFENWNTFVAPAVAQPFGPGQELTCFWAKGDPGTTRLALEWTERDGSRWIATVPLTTTWSYYALSPYDFAYWRDNPSQGRGGEGDHLRPQNAQRFTVGLSGTHTPLPGGRHEFWVDQIGVAKNPVAELAAPGTFTVPPMELLCPGYKFFQVTDAVSLKVSADQTILDAEGLPLPKDLMSVQPRPEGTGFNKERRWRYIPLLEATDAEGRVCGTPACLMLSRAGSSQLASFALPAPVCKTPGVLGMISQVAQRMQRGFYLLEGGAEFFAYFEGEAVTLGCRTISFGGKPQPKCQAHFTVTSATGAELDTTVPVTDGVAQCRWTPPSALATTYQVQCVLLDEAGQTLDRLAHPVVVWRPSEKPDFVQIKNGEFIRHGKPWRVYGVNYMPSSGIGTEDGPYFEYWIGKQAYDPIIVQRDLERIKALGLNTISIFCYYGSRGSRNLLDILERCRRLDIMVNLSLRPGTPLDFRLQEMQALIETFRLAQNDTVFAYDLAWEPQFGNHGMIKRWAPEWERWIVDRYGSLENAEADWGVPVPREGGQVTVPFDQQLDREGPQRVMVCAYRRFLDDLLSKKHALANNFIKSLDPNHFTAFRMSEAGNPTVGPSWIAYDFKGLCRSVDIMEPEGYGRIGEWDRVRPGRFTLDYARCMAPGKPVMWAEFGFTSWDNARMERDLRQEEWIGGFYDRFYRMCQEGDADGSICWWWPGGFRVGENSDFGIINPDGSWRANSKAIHGWAARMTAPRAHRSVDEWITVDRDASGGGIFGVYQAVQERYWKLVDAGKNPGLRTDGYGLDSATAPRRAVGNLPYRPGMNPHKYLNAEFDRLEIRDAQGEWQTVEDGGVVKVRRGTPLVVRAQVGNNGEAKWLGAETPSRSRAFPGQVRLTAGEASIAIPVDVPAMGTATITDFQVCELKETMDLTFEMQAAPDVSFGEKLRVKVQAQ